MKFAGGYGKAIMASSVAFAAAEVAARFAPDTSGAHCDDTVGLSHSFTSSKLTSDPCKGGFVTIPVEPFRLSEPLLGDCQFILVIIVYCRHRRARVSRSVPRPRLAGYGCIQGIYSRYHRSFILSAVYLFLGRIYHVYRQQDFLRLRIG